MKRNVSKWLAALVVAAVATVPSLSHAMNGAAPLGYGIKSQGMGGVGIALPQDSLSAANNPAGMWMVGCRADIGLSYVFQDVKATALSPTDEVLQRAKSDKGLWFPELAVNWNFIPCQSVGIAFYNLGSFHTDYGAPLVAIGAEDNSSAFANQWSIMPSWSWKINGIHSVGVAANIVIGTFKVEGAGLVANPLVSLYPNDANNRGWDYALGMNVRVGWMGQLSRCFRVGATLQTKTWSEKFEKYQGFLPDEGDMDWPLNIGLGFSWDILDCLTLSGDYVAYYWSDSKLFGNALRGGGSIGLGEDTLYGASDGPGLGWDSQSVYKLGVDYRLWRCLTLRAGYNYGRNPVYTTESAANRLTAQVVEHHITVGATYALCCGEISAFYWYGFQSTTHGRDSSAIVFGQTTGNNYNVSNTQQAVGLGYGVCF